LLETGDITNAGQLLHQSQSDALAQNKSELLPNIDSYTAYMAALLQNQKKLLHTDDEGAVRMVSMAEKAHDLLVQMEGISGVSDDYSSMRVSAIANSELRQASLRPTSFLYDSTIEAVANSSIAAHEANYTTNFTINAPIIARRWLQRMETLASDPISGVNPTINSYYNAMRASSVITVMNKQSKSHILTQAIFDMLRQNPGLDPSVKEYRLLLQTWSSSVSKEGAFKATGVWISMQRAFRKGDVEMEPTLEDGKMVLKAWARSL
jgi:hypothetical protein